MHIKTYLGPDTKTVLAQIKDELGPEAVILSSRSVRRDGQNLTEITAGVERGEATDAGESPSASPLEGGGQRNTFFGSKNWQKEWPQIRDHLLALLKPHMRLADLTQRQRAALDHLEQEGVNDNAILLLYRVLKGDAYASILDPLSGLVPCRPWGALEWTQPLHVVTGPAGVGKTVTTLRLALVLKNEMPDMRICLVNADLNKGHGRLVLKHYAELSDLLYCEAASARDLAKWAKSGRDVDKFIIDFPAVARDDSLAGAMRRMGFVSKNLDAHLLLSHEYSDRQLSAFAEMYRTESLASLVWTKLDEAVSYGEIVNVAVATELPVSALSVGANLTNSLVPAQKAFLWKLLFKHDLPKPPGKKINFAQKGAKSFAQNQKIGHNREGVVEEAVFDSPEADSLIDGEAVEEIYPLERSVLTPRQRSRAGTGERLRAKV